MTRLTGNTICRRRVAKSLGAFLLLLTGAAFAAGTPPATNSSPLSVLTPPTAPLWRNLTPAQQHALAPLAREWDGMDASRREKWLKIGNRFASMRREEQERVQERMRDWVRLTPEQRKIARENYTKTKKVDPEKKSVRWEQYQQLPEEQKQELAAKVRPKKHVANLPIQPPAKTVAPIKATPKPVLARSVQPGLAAKPAFPSIKPVDKPVLPTSISPQEPR
ncbi:MAG: hypothetical protein K0S28_1286 [Paucimonas sp.]|jgi:hypothetical protein|nr:hypothetical protein [Paucimonas sp.]